MIGSILLLLHVDLDVCIANKGEKIEEKIEENRTQIQGEFLHCFAFEHVSERGRNLQRGEI